MTKTQPLTQHRRAVDFANPAPTALQLEDSVKLAVHLMCGCDRPDMLVLDDDVVLGRIRLQSALRPGRRAAATFVLELVEPAVVIHEDAPVSHAFLVAARNPGQVIAVVDDDDRFVGELGARELAVAAHSIVGEDAPPSSRRAA